jgi:hypothetical protein
MANYSANASATARFVWSTRDEASKSRSNSGPSKNSQDDVFNVSCIAYTVLDWFARVFECATQDAFL